MSPEWSSSERRRLVKKLLPDERLELRRKISTIKEFAAGFVGIALRPYQVEAAEAVVRSVLARDGSSFVLLFARQSGKDELIANLILYLLARLAETGASIVCAQPTFRPQTLTAMDRLQARAAQRPFFALGGFHRTHGYVYEFLSARVTYLSADASASVVGATADRLLIINEAQDVAPGVYDKRFAPMAASGNATRLFSGTAWTGDTLLDREKRIALELEKHDSIRRLFLVDGKHVSRCNRLYARFLKDEIEKLGRGHPLIRTQYFCENVDARSRMFTPAHRLLMLGEGASSDYRPLSLHEEPNQGEGSTAQLGTPPYFGAVPKWGGDGGRAGTATPPLPTADSRSGAETPPGRGRHPCAFLLDVAGQEESSTSYGSDSSETLFEPHSNSMISRDAVTLRIVEIDLSTLSTLQAPTYRAVHLQQWTGQNHLTVFGQVKALAEAWHPQHIVIDATGVGEGLWAMLDKAFPTRVRPVKFTQGVKSELGYGFLAIINTGRFRDEYAANAPLHLHLPADGKGAGSPVAGASFPSRAQIDKEYAACESEILIGPRKTMRWGVPDGRRDEDGQLIHDDIPVTDSLASILDRLEWSIHSPTLVVPARDPLEDIDSGYGWLER